MHALWDVSDNDAVIAVMSAPERLNTPVLRVTDFKTLCPHKWLTGETIEYYLQLTKNQHNTAKRIFLFSYYTVGVIMNGQDDAIRRQLMSQVNFDDYDAAMGVLNVNQHWKLLFLNVASKEALIIDPMSLNEQADSKEAGQKFRKYFQMRHNILGRKEWCCHRWNPATVPHTHQQDGSSCGVFVMKIGEEILKMFPDIPSQINIDGTLNGVKRLRERIATTILASSEPVKDVCQLCGLKETAGKSLWIQCDACMLWTHMKCTDLTQEEIKSITNSNSKWFCQYFTNAI
nr:ubiquitin-like-specific protease 1 isoform X2 [Paramormyrops kingsleyae]